MSKHWLRHFVIALVCGLVPLIPVVPVQASSQSHAAAVPAASIKPAESAVLQKFRDSGPPTMAQAAQFEATATPRKFAQTRVAATAIPQAVSNPRLFREVFGFAFASSLGDPTIGYPSWNFGLLSTVAYFGIHVDWTGDFSGGSAWNTWNDPNGPVPGFIQTAHANGTKVVLSIAMFDSTAGTPNMCSALQRSSLTIQRTVAQVLAKGIDGVNVDYESNNTQCTDPSTGAVQYSQSMLTAFVKNLRAALPSGSYLSIDTYSGAAGFRDSSGAYLGFFDIGALANYVDSFFIMAYDMEYGNWSSPPLSCPTFCIGPTAPLTTYLFNDSRASSEYRAVVPASKIIMGIPYYGRKECVAGYTPSNAPPNAVGSTTPVADGYLDASTENGYVNNSDYHIHRDTRDAAGSTRWDTFTSSTAQCTRELYWDDATSLGNKYNLIINDHLRGAGIFALNYGGGAPELWSLINSKFGHCANAAISADKTSPQIPTTSITFTGSAFCAGTAEYRFWISTPAGGWTVAQPYSTSNTWTWTPPTGSALGTYRFEIDARNLGLSVNYDTYSAMSFRLALCSTPTLATDHGSPQLPGAKVTFTASGACQGTPEYRFSETAPGATQTVVQDYSTTATLPWDTTNNPYGTYGFAVDVRVKGVSAAAEASQSITFVLASCIGTALTGDKTSPQPTGTAIGLSGAATCVGSPQYRFLIQAPGGAMTLVQDFSSTSTYAWNANGAGGIYGLELDAKDASASASTMTSSIVTFNLASCSSVTIATNPASPEVPGTAVGLTATATCPGTTQYRFSIKKPNAASTIVQDYGGPNTYSWDTTGLALGGYSLAVDVRNQGASAASEATANVVYTIANAACTTPTLTSDLASPQGAGAVVTFTATTTTCPSPLYRFFVATPGVGWVQVQDYGTLNTFRWTVNGAGGTYQIEADVRDSSRPVAYDQYAVVTYVINSCTGAALSPSVPSPQTAGTPVTLTASASASFCPKPLYEFWILAPGSASWSMAQGYSASPTLAWSNGGKALGTYRIGVWVRDTSSAGTVATSLGSYDTNAGLLYTLTTPRCASVTLSAAPVSPSSSGTQVTVTAAASGCASPLYEFWMLAQGAGRWLLVQPYSPSATFHWNSTGAPPGTEQFGVWIRDASSPGATCSSFGCNDAVAGIPYTVSAPSCASVTISAAPASPVAHGSGTQVTFTAVASGCSNPNPLYEFWMLPAGSSTWILVRGYSSSATFQWNTNGAPAGTEHFGVWVRDANSPGVNISSMGRYDALVGTTYTLT
jgi:spore germination protein YaaH